jgi:hypothetical protein
MMKNSTTKDLRYLEPGNRDIFIEYAFLALGSHFNSRNDLLGFFNKIKTNERKALFLRTAMFYLFLVKKGDWTVEVPNSNKIIDYLTNTYKYVGIFSLIESLSEDRHIDFYRFIVSRKSKVKFPVDRAMLDKSYENYNNEFGSIKRCISFFKALGVNRQKDLVSRLTVSGSEASIENLSKYLYKIRSKFVHEAELVHDMSDGTSFSFSEGHSVLCSLSITDAMLFFEEGLIEYFKDS